MYFQDRELFRQKTYTTGKNLYILYVLQSGSPCLSVNVIYNTWATNLSISTSDIYCSYNIAPYTKDDEGNYNCVAVCLNGYF